MPSTCSTVVLLLLATALAFAVDANPRGPVVAILTMPGGETKCAKHASLTKESVAGLRSDGSCVVSIYVKWLEAAGARVTYVPYDAPEDELQRIFRSTNGFLIPGGGLTLKPDTQFYKAAQYMQTLAMKANHAGEHYPIWGTCMGFQLLCILGAQDWDVLDRADYFAEDFSYPLKLTVEAAHSRLLGTDSCPADVRDIVQNQPVTTNLHHDGITPANFAGSARLSSMYRALSTNVDSHGKPFVSTMEAKDFPFYGVQWHPERPQFEWDAEPHNINHSADAIRVMQHMANFFVAEARKSTHSYPTVEELDRALVYNFAAHGTSSYQYYYFPPSKQ